MNAYGRFEAEDYTSQIRRHHAAHSICEWPRYRVCGRHQEWRLDLFLENFDFGKGAASYKVEVASATEGGSLEFRIDRRMAQWIGSCAVEKTGGKTNWKTKTGRVDGAVGLHDLYLRFAGKRILFNVNQFTFQPAK